MLAPGRKRLAAISAWQSGRGNKGIQKETIVPGDALIIKIPSLSRVIVLGAGHEYLPDCADGVVTSHLHNIM